MNASSRTPRPRHRPFAFADAEFAGAREAFDAAGFEERAVAEACGARGIPSLAEVPAETAALRASSDSALHVLIRLFVIGLPSPAAEIRHAIAPAALESWMAGGLLVARGDLIAAAVKVTPCDGLLLAFDRDWPGQLREDSDHVMGPSDSARTLATLTMRDAVESSLDLGTGCGYLAFLLARHSERVVATDINPRAVAFTEFNAKLNRISNVEALAGDRFGPVEGRSFDLVVSNPPFMISPEDRIAYLSGGMKADAFARGIVEDAPRVLCAGGCLQMICNWVELEGVEWTDRLRGWFERTGCEAWVLRSSTTDPLSYALGWMGVGSVGASKRSAERLDAWLRYYAQEKIASIGAGAVTMRRTDGTPWFRAFDGPDRAVGPCGDQVSERLRALSLMQGRDEAAILATVFTPSPDLRLTQECRATPEGWAQASATIRMIRGLAYTEEVDTYVAELIAACDGARPLRDAIASTAAALGWSASDVPTETTEIVRQLVDEGFLSPLG